MALPRGWGVSRIGHLRIPVATVVSMVAEGQANDEIVAELAELELEDIREAFRYAAEAVRERELPLSYRPIGCRARIRTWTNRGNGSGRYRLTPRGSGGEKGIRTPASVVGVQLIHPGRG